jgi:DNA invertase Pin-like site-specific DNA recombinase
MLIGYARVSTQDQNLELQLDALRAAGCGMVYQDKASGAKTDRPGLDEAFSHLRAGDTLVVWRLDRLGRTLRHLIETVTDLEEKGIGFRSLQESIDTTTSSGKLIFHVFSALAEFERNLTRERTQAGLTAARARGRKGGRPRKLDSAHVALLYQLYDERERTVMEICRLLKISKPTLYDYLDRRAAEQAAAP